MKLSKHIINFIILCSISLNLVLLVNAKDNALSIKMNYSKSIMFNKDDIISSPMDLSLAYAFPVPFKPSEGHSEITFMNLPYECSIKIYTLTGELVKTIEHNTGLSHNWDVKNESEKFLASGVYIYYIESSDDSNEGRLIIVR
ncbi:hypothetical protein ACFL4O_00465 [bacterium]